MPKKRYTPEQDKIIKRLHKKDWSACEIAYHIFLETETSRPDSSIKQRQSGLIEAGEIESRGRGKRFVTQEALDWHNRTFKTEIGPASMLVLVENKSTTGKGRRNSKDMSSRELLGLSKKGIHEPKPSYTAKTVLIYKRAAGPISGEDIINLFQDLVDSAVDEGKTVIDIQADLKQISA